MKALLVIDMLRDFIDKDGALYCGDSCRKIIPFVRKKIEEFHRKRQLVVFVRDSHRPDDLEFKLFSRHSVRNTPGAEIIAELPVGEKDEMVPKTRYSAFYGTKLEQILKKHKVTEVQVVGVCISICVMDTVGDLRNRDYKVIVYRQGVADFDQDFYRFSLARMRKIYGATII